jgi:regulator of protease activity HflC (stomatin/prohibitin superfamily)
MSERARVSLPGGRVVGPVSLALAGGLVVALVAGWWMCTQPVWSDEFAIKQIYLGPGKGIQKDWVGPGLQFVMPGYERLHVFPRDMQLLDLNSEESTYAAEHLSEDYTKAPPIRIQTSDGFQVTVDVTVTYRVIDPYLVLTKVGPGRLFETNVVERYADKILRQSFGRLEAEDFYRDNERMGAEDDARKALEAELTQWGLQLFGVLVRDYSYEERFQHQIEARKNEDQRKFKNQAETLRETRLQEKNRRVADMQRQIESTRGDGDLAVRRINADAELYYQQQVAEGDRALAIADADAARLERNALEVTGAGNLVGLEMAEVMNGTSVIVVSTTGPGAVNPLDLNALVGGW